MALSKPVCNIAMWNKTAQALINPGWVISEYLCDTKNSGTVNSINLGNLLTMWIRGSNPFVGKTIPKSP
jgi:hypothetical protein